MRAYELFEGRNTPSIVVDVQPKYTGGESDAAIEWNSNLMGFLSSQSGPILMFVNADHEAASSGDSIGAIQVFWEDHSFEPDDWDRVEINNKGYGYFRAWMDHDVSDAAIIKAIREMYKQKVTNSKELFPDEEDYSYAMEQFLGDDFKDAVITYSISIKWTSVAQLKRFTGAYIMGGARLECLKEVELLMNAFNIRYKEINEFIYG